MNNHSKYIKCTSPIGDIYIVQKKNRISAIYLGKEDFLAEENQEDLFLDEEDAILNTAKNQLKEYFAGKRTEFDLPIEYNGTNFQTSVWKELCCIPYGETRSYQDIAVSIGNPKAVRAIGQANKANKLPIVIPCHRVIGKNHSLTGYAGTRIDIKEILLSLEGATGILSK